MISLIECPNCRDKLEEPVFLPCGHTVCRKHSRSNDRVSCAACRAEHETPTGGFTSNLLVQNLLENELYQVNQSAELRIASEVLGDLQTLVDEVKQLRDDPVSEIDKSMSEMKNAVDTRREEVKQATDKEALELIGNIEKVTKELFKSVPIDPVAVSDDTDQLIRTFESQDLIHWQTELKKNHRNVKKLKLFQDEMLSKYGQLYRERQRLKRTLFANDQFDELQRKKKRFCQELTEPLS